jgi:hypothetical protein
MPQKVKVQAKKTVYTYSYLYIAALEALSRAKSTEVGSFYTCMTAELFSAFSLEAYLNHLGVQKLPFWESVERKLGPNEKLKIICHEIGLKPDFGKRPFQSFGTLFQLRNSLVHGGTEYLEINDEQLLNEREKPKLPETKWKPLINLDMATQFVEDTEKMIEIIHAKSGNRRNPLLTPETSQWGMSPSAVDPE